MQRNLLSLILQRPFHFPSFTKRKGDKKSPYQEQVMAIILHEWLREEKISIHDVVGSDVKPNYLAYGIF